MGNLTFKPASGGVLKLQDAGSTDRITVTDGGTTVLNEDGGAAALTVETDGDVTVETGSLKIGTAGQGIDFAAQTVSSQTGTTPDTSTGDEVLNHYETGRWSPVVSDGSNHMSMSGSGDLGYYTKVGNLVTVSGQIKTTSIGSASGDIYILGLPFTVAAGTTSYSGGAAANGTGFSTAAAGYIVSYYGRPAETSMSLRVWDSTAGATNMQATEWSDDGAIIIGFSYRAA